MSVQDWHSHAAAIQPLQPATGHRAQVTLPADPAPEQTLELAARLAADLSAELAADLAALTRVLLGVEATPATPAALADPQPVQPPLGQLETAYVAATVPPQPLEPLDAPAAAPLELPAVDVPPPTAAIRPTAVLDGLAFLDL